MNLVTKFKSFSQHPWGRVSIFLFPLASLAAFAYLKIAHNFRYMQILEEDHIVEYLQSIFYLLAALVALCISKEAFTRRLSSSSVLYAIIFVILVFLAMEEISWGQRIFGFEGPASIVERNYQHEFNFHNLGTMAKVLHAAYIAVGLLGTFADILLPLKLRKKLHPDLALLIPPRILALYFLPVFCIYFYLDYAGRFLFHWLHIKSLKVGAFIVPRDQEPAELLLALGVFLVIALALTQKKVEDKIKEE